MRDPNESDIGLHLRPLLEKKFGGLFAWEVPPIKQTVGPYQPEIFENFANKRDELLDAAHHALRGFVDVDISVLIDENLPDPENKRTAWKSFLRDDIQKLQHRKPSWFSGGFGHPDYEADFEYWGQMEDYTLHEALMLSVGVEPEHLSEDWLQSAKKEMKRTKLVPTIEFLIKRHEQFRRKYPHGPFGTSNASPRFIWDWIEEVRIDVHEGFRDALGRRLYQIKVSTEIEVQNKRNDSALGKPDPREIDKITQLFAAMAIDQLGYQPSALRSPIPKEIADLAASMGLSISDDTVRKYLRRGAAFIPEGWKPD